MGWGKERKDDDFFIDITLTMPRSMYKKVSVIAHDKDMPVSRLMSYAVYNELETETPFNFDLSMPKEDFVEKQYFKQAEKLLALITSFPQFRGTGLDMLVMGRDFIGINSKEELMLAYRELLNAELIQIVNPKDVKSNGRFPKDFIHVKPVVYRYSNNEVKNRAPKKLNGVPINDIINKK